MDASTLMARLAETLDSHSWDALPHLLHPDFACRYVHTGETFDRETWVRVNAEYPGFQDFALEDSVATADRAAGRARVTALVEGEIQVFEVASFITVRGGLIADMTEVWTDVDVVAPSGTRPA